MSEVSDILERLLTIKGYSYHIWDYSVGHSTLVIRAVKEQEKEHNIQLTFVNIYYVEFPVKWNGDLYLASDDELVEILKKAGLNNSIERMPLSFIKENLSLYKANNDNGVVYILGKLGSIEYDVEPIYNG